MEYISTRNIKKTFMFKDVFLKGLAPDGGLFVPKNFPKLLVCNHASYLDILILGSLIKTSFVAKKEVSSWPLLGILAKLQNTIFIDRKISSLTMQKNKIIKHLQEKKKFNNFSRRH